MPGSAKQNGRRRGPVRPPNRNPKGSPGSPRVHVINGVTAKRKRSTRRAPDATGRLDIAAKKCLELIGANHKDPRVRVAYKHAKPVLEGVIQQYLGPRNPIAQQLSKVIRKGVHIMADLQAEQRLQGANAYGRQ